MECVISAFQPYLLSIITANFQKISALTDSQQIQEISNNSLELLGIIVGSVLLGFILRLTARLFHIKSSINIIERLRNNLFYNLQWIKDNEFNKLSVSSVVSRATNDSYQYQETVLMFFLFFFESAILIIGSLIFCIFISPTLSIIFIFIVPIIILVNYFYNKKAKKYYEKNLDELDSVNRIMRENIAGTKTVRSFRLWKIQLERFNVHNSSWYKSILKGEMLIYLGVIFLFFILNFAVILVLFVSGALNYYNSNNTGIDVATVVAFANYLIYAVFCAFGISNSLVSINRTKPCIKRIDEILNIKIEDKKDNSLSPSDLVPSIEFKNVCYSYGIKEEKPIVNNISFKIDSGKILGIIGPTGSGKSTIVSLACNIAEPESGTIKFGNYNINQLNTNYLRKQVSVAFQEKFIFSGTIKSNIIMGNLEANQQKIEWASKQACADEFINKTKNKYESEVIQNGNNLSGGQKQRLSLARAFAKEAGIYILDDSLSALDNLTRDKVLKNIKNNFKEKTFIIVSQQVKTIMNADKIIVLDKGEIIDSGTHKELIKKCSLYKKIYDSQRTIGE
ncbi:MAG: ABC transporter ATP-binding protein/permease [Malacoplasma sp.]|nr:ABC transporter ATP-binding protein/permease [Malacoplasma sp.]